MKEYLDEIKTAEAEARRIIEEAEKQAKAVISNANLESEEFLLRVKKDAEEKSRLLIEEARKQAEKEVENIKASYGKKIEEIINNSNPKKAKASQLILEKVVNFYGNS